MSIRYYKYKFKYDDNCGHLQETVIYQQINNSNNIETYYNDKGNIIELNGTTDYMNKLGYILSITPDKDIEVSSISYEEISSIFSSND